VRGRLREAKEKLFCEKSFCEKLFFHREVVLREVGLRAIVLRREVVLREAVLRREVCSARNWSAPNPEDAASTFSDSDEKALQRRIHTIRKEQFHLLKLNNPDDQKGPVGPYVETLRRVCNDPLDSRVAIGVPGLKDMQRKADTDARASILRGYSTAPAVGCTVSFWISDCRKTGSVATVELPVRLREEPRGTGRSHPRKICGESRMVTIIPPRPLPPVLVAPVISNSVVRQDKVPSTVKTIQHQHVACQYGIVTQHTVTAMMNPRTVTVPTNVILRSVAFGNASGQLAKHKQVYKWAAERVLNRTNIQWSRSRMPTLASLEDDQFLFLMGTVQGGEDS